MIVATAPGRCGILGNPTDMYGGSVISCSTTERARCQIESASDLIIEADGEIRQVIRRSSDMESKGDRLDLIRAVLRALEIHPDTHAFHLRTSTDIPLQAGLSGSTAQVASVFGATSRWLGMKLHPYAMAEAIRNVEYEFLGVVCGFQDAYMTVFGGLNYLDFRGKASHLPPQEQPLATVEQLNWIAPPAPLILAHSGMKHHSGSVHKSVRERWMEGEAAVCRGYERIAHLAQQHKSSILAGDWATLAHAMNENQEIQQGIGASGPVCDELVRVARANGALAAKLAGAGHGGTILALTLEPERTAAALRAAGAARILYPSPVDGLTFEYDKVSAQHPGPKIPV